MAVEAAEITLADHRLKTAREIRGFVALIDEAFLRPTSENIEAVLEIHGEFPDLLKTYYSLRRPREFATDTLQEEIQSLVEKLKLNPRQDFEKTFPIPKPLLEEAGMNRRLINVLFQGSRPDGKAIVKVQLRRYGGFQLYLENVVTDEGLFLGFSFTGGIARNFSIGTYSEERKVTFAKRAAEKFIDRSFGKEHELDTISRHYQIGSSLIRAASAIVTYQSS